MPWSTFFLFVMELLTVGVIAYFNYILIQEKREAPYISRELEPIDHRHLTLSAEMRLKVGLEKHCINACLNVLSEVERVQYDVCYYKSVSVKSVKKFGTIATGSCHFQNGFRRYSVALGSFQGSGNTWLRGLLEKITGICTGSLYCDGALRTKGFTGEGTHGPSVIAIKSHTINPLFIHMDNFPKRKPDNTPVFGAAIFLIRNPKDAMVAEWHRERSKRLTNKTVSNHFLVVGGEYFGNNSDWNKYVIKMSDRWKLHICGWLINGKNNPVHILRYEDLKSDTENEMLSILKFFGGINLSIENIKKKIRLGYSSFYRNHTDNFHHFTSHQQTYVSKVIQDTINILNEHLNTSSPIFEYLHSYISS